jgi:hypothetical protein
MHVHGRVMRINDMVMSPMYAATGYDCQGPCNLQFLPLDSLPLNMKMCTRILVAKSD